MKKKGSMNWGMIVLVLFIVAVVSTGMSSVFAASGADVWIYLVGLSIWIPLIAVLILAFVVKRKEKKTRRKKHKMLKVTRFFLKTMVVLYFVIPVVGITVAAVMGSAEGPKTERTDGALIVNGIPLPVCVPGGIPIMLIVALVAVGVGYGVTKFLFDKINKNYS